MEATVIVRYTRSDGVILSRETTIRSSTYDRTRSVAGFKAKVRKQALASINSVLGASPEVRVES